MDRMKCPQCGSTNIRFDMRPAGTKSKSNYYRTGIKDSWILPVGQKTYKSNRRYKTMCLCQDCGNLWERKNSTGKNAVQSIQLLCCLVVYIALFAAIFSSDPELMQYRTTYMGCIIIMTVILFWKLRKEVKSRGTKK